MYLLDSGEAILITKLRSHMFRVRKILAIKPICGFLAQQLITSINSNSLNPVEAWNQFFSGLFHAISLKLSTPMTDEEEFL